MMNVFWAEVRQTARSLVRNPLFSAITILTLGLGIGANTAIFSAVDALLLRNLPYPDPDQLVMLWSDGRERGFAERDVVNPGVMKEWERSLSTTQSVAGIDFWDTTLTADRGPVLVEGAKVSANFFDTLGVPILLGRGFTADEELESGPRVLVVSHAFWQRELGGSADVLGRAVELERQSWTVIGVLAPGFSAPTLPRARVFRPLQGSLDPEDGFYMPIVARLRPGIGIEQADADLDAVQARLAERYPDLRQLSGDVQPLHEFLVQDVSRQLLVLLGATFLVLVIACANIANLLLARAVGRSRELAIRTAIGASRRHIVRQVLIESVLLSLAGTVLGIGLAWVGVEWIATALPPDLARNAALGIDLRVMGFAFVLALGTGVVAGSVPALLSSRRDAGAALRSGGRGSAGGRDGSRVRALLVACTFALALALTVSAGLFLKSLLHILDVDPGFRPDGLLTFSLSLAEIEYPDGDALRAAQDALMERLAAVPGATGVGFTSTLPMGNLVTDTGTALEGAPPEEEPLHTWFSRVSPGYLPTLGAPILRGRDVAATDRAGNPCSVVVNETYAARYLGDREPVGTRVILSPRGSAIPCEIVGVSRDLRFNTLAEPPDPSIYVPMGQFPNRRFFVIMRTTGDPLALLSGAREAVAAVDPRLALWSPLPMTSLVSETVRTPRQVAVLVGAFAVLALLLAASGVYGVATYNVNARLREFGVRTALGARQIDLLWQVLSGGLWLVGGGMAVGVLLTLAFGRLLGALLYEVEPFDLQVFAFVALLLVAAALLAMLVPARRAARVQPMEALRYE